MSGDGAPLESVLQSVSRVWTRLIGGVQLTTQAEIDVSGFGLPTPSGLQGGP